ncbi:MAG: alpha-mannosidase, partial [Clostridia bacterium]|nr:alpha-mannosidase [Clostridia bacterium]
VLNDCKYGISCLGGNLRLSLLKGGARPDPVTDIGTHFMRYSLLPHEGAGDFENVILPAYDFNYLPVEIRGRAALPQLFAIEGAGVMAEAVKPAENGTSAFALRLYESRRSHAKIRVSIPGAKKVSLTNFLEEEKQALSPDGGGKYSLCFRPFEIKTLLIER